MKAEALAAGGPAGYCTAIGLACTSMSFTLGPAAVDRALQSAHPGAVSLQKSHCQTASDLKLIRERV